MALYCNFAKNKGGVNALRYIVIIFYILITILISYFYGNFPVRHLAFPLVSCILVLWLSGKYTNKKQKFLNAFFSLSFLIMSVMFIPSFSHTTMDFINREYLHYIAFSTSFILLIVVFFNYFLTSWNKLRFILLLFVTLPGFMVWYYYLLSGAFISVETCMAILQTNYTEAFEYTKNTFSLNALLCIITYICLLFVANESLQDSKGNDYGVVSVHLILFIIITIFFMYRTRDNLVVNLLYDTYKYQELYNEYINNRVQRRVALSQLQDLEISGNEGVYVLVIGESATRDHLGSYGYNRNTTPWMSGLKESDNFYQFSNAWSCAADTVHALVYALTNKNQYNNIKLENAISLIDVANAAGYKTIWISNQAKIGLADTPITAIATEAKEQIWLRENIGHLKDGGYLDLPSFYDSRIIDCIDKLNVSSRTMIVIHLMGSHANYSIRYPKEYAVFKDGKSFIDEYDNSILYTDFVLEKIYDKIKKIKNLKR